MSKDQPAHDDQWSTVERMQTAAKNSRTNRTSWRDTAHTTVGARTTVPDTAQVADSVGAHA